MTKPGPNDLTATRRQAWHRVEDLRTELDAIIQSTTEMPDDEHDAEGATIGYERARVAALLAKAQKDLADYDTALLRVKLGSYGACVGCGAEIPAERLAALPSTSVCVGCANGYLTQRRDPTHRRSDSMGGLSTTALARRAREG